MNKFRFIGLFACFLTFGLWHRAFAQPAIINEWSQGPTGCTSEWIEILVIQDGLDLRGWSLRESTPAAATIVTFANNPIWSSMPAGALIVVYNPNSGCGKDPILGPDDLTLGCDYSYTASGSDPTLFSSNWSSWVAFSNSTNTDNPELWNASNVLVQDWDQGNNAGFTVGTLRPGSNSGVYYSGNTAAGVSNPANWVKASPSSSPSLTPARPNVAANGTWIRSLQRPSVRFTVPGTTFCEGDQVTLTVEFEGQAPFDYTYTDGTNLFNGSAASSPHNITVTLAAGSPQFWFTSVTNALFPTTGPTCDTATLLVTPDPTVGTIVGPTNPCIGSSVRYYVDGGTTADTSKGWSVPVGWVITAGATTDTVTVTVGAGSGNVGLTAFNRCNSTYRFIAVAPNDVPTVGAVVGPDTVCVGQTVQYAVQGGLQNFTPPATWSFPAGWVQQSLNSSGDTVTVLVGSVTAGSVSVSAANVCGSRTQILAVLDVDSLPVVAGINGPATVCAGDTVTYSTQGASGNVQNSQWTVPGTWGILSGQGTGTITVRVGTGSGNVQVQVTGVCGTAQTSLAVTTLSLPQAPPMLQGDPTPCVGSIQVYNLPTPVSAPNTVQWTVPTGWTVISGQNNDTIQVVVNSSDTLRAVLTNSCGSITRQIAVVAQPLPSFNGAGAIVGSLTPCVGSNATYTVGTVNNSTSLNWRVPATWTLVSGQGTNSITVTTTTDTGYVVVTATNACGSTSDSILVVPNTEPQPFSLTSSQDTICLGATTQLLLVGTHSPQSTLSWTPTTGIIGSTTNDTAVVQPSATTTYTLTITNKGCTRSASITVVVESAPNVQITTSSPTHCVGSLPVQLQATGADSYRWSPLTGLTNPNTPNPTADPATTTTYQVVGTNASGCSDTAFVTIEVIQPFTPVIDAPPNFCVNNQWSPVSCANCQAGDVVEWLYNGQVVGTGPNPTVTLTQVGNAAQQFPITLLVTRGGCDFTSQVFTATSVPNAEANNFTTNPAYTPGDVLPAGTEMQFLSQSPSANYFEWVFIAPDGTRDTLSSSAPFALYTFTQEGRYQVVYTAANRSQNGFACSYISTDNFYDVAPDLKDIIVYLPNVFTPNGDGQNDIFKPTIIGNIQTYAMTIYDRWGTQVFESASVNDNWTGGDAPEGVYVYVLQILANNGKKTEYTGTLTLLR